MVTGWRGDGQQDQPRKTFDWESLAQKTGIPFFGKQWGTYQSNPLTRLHGVREAERRDPPKNGKGGALIGGQLYREFPG